MSLRRATMRNAKVASITHDQSRAKLAAVINAVPRSWSRTSFLWTKERLITQHGPRRRRVCTFQRAIADAARGRLADALLSGDARSLLLPHIY